MHSYRTTIRLHDTDAAGRLFFAHQFRIAHEAYESFLESIGFPLREMLKKKAIGFPIVRAEADYKYPLSVGDQVEVKLKPVRTGSTSFTLLAQLVCASRTVGHVTTVHVAVDPARGTSCPLPARLRAALRKASANT